MKQYKIHLLFFALALLHLYSIWVNNNTLRLISKPLICISLIFMLYQATKLQSRTQKLIGLGLLFGCLGDIFLMLPNQFVAGLGAFLIGHIFYVLSFVKQSPKHIWSKPKDFVLIALVLLAYSYYLYTILSPSLGPLQIPVILYILVISAMAFFAYTRRYNVSFLSFILCFIGALLFIFSDSILALNKFVAYLAHSGIYIMSSYILAQYAITLACIVDKKR